MVKQAPFKLEQFMDDNETDVDYNLGETCCYSLSIKDIEKLSGNKFDYEQFANERLAYSYIRGSPNLKKRICGLYETLKPENLIITNGGIGGNFLSFYSLAGPNDHVVVFTPIYQQLWSVPEAFGADVDILPLRYEDKFMPDINKLAKMVKSNTKLIILNNPNNPTGCAIPTDILKQVVEIAKKSDAYVLCDEVYRPLFHSLPKGVPSPKSIVDLYSKGISISSMSKTLSVAGIRLGWIASKDKAFLDACWLRRDFNMISVSVADDLIAQYVLANKDVILKRNYELCRENLAILDEKIAQSKGKLQYIKPVAGTTAFVKVNLDSKLSTMKLTLDLIHNSKTLIVPGETFGYEGFLRIGFANRKEDVIHGMDNLLKYISDK